MTDLRNVSRKFLAEFIDLYKSLPCLWDVGSTEYSNKDLKEAAYSLMVDKLREVDPTSCRSVVIRKIDSIRGCFRKECRKIEEAKKQGEIHYPKLWYFQKLLFLKDDKFTVIPYNHLLA